MEETLNNSENKKQSGFVNIKNMQTIEESKSLNKLAASLRASKQRLNSLSVKILEIKKQNQAKAEKPAVQKPAETVAVKNTKPTSSMGGVENIEKTEKPVQKTQPVREQNVGRQNNFAQNKQNTNRPNGANGYQPRQNNFNGQRPGGKFVPTGERRFDNNGQGGYRQNNY